MSEGKAATVNLKRKIKQGTKWNFVPVAKKKDKYLPDQVLIAGVPTKATGGTFYIEWYEQGRRVQKAVGTHGDDAVEAWKTQTHINNLRSTGVTIEDDAPQIRDRGATIKHAVKSYLEDAQVTLRQGSMAKYKGDLNEFMAFTDKIYVKDVTRDDIRAYMTHCVQKNLEPVTAKIKARIVACVMRREGATITMKKGDWPKSPKKLGRPMYQIDTLKKLLVYTSRERYILYSFFLHTGFRLKEATFCSWADVNFSRNEISVTEKKLKEHGLVFKPKNHEERTVPVVSELMELLKEQRDTVPAGSFLVFPSPAGRGLMAKHKPGGRNLDKVLEMVKQDAFDAGLNCGRCKVTVKGKATTCAKHPRCRKFGIHMFRHTAATNWLRNGFTLKDVSTLLGHADLETTKIYLHAIDEDDMHSKLRNSKLGSMYIPDELKPSDKAGLHVVGSASKRRA
jgi:integrase